MEPGEKGKFLKLETWAVKKGQKQRIRKHPKEKWVPVIPWIGEPDSTSRKYSIGITSQKGWSSGKLDFHRLYPNLNLKIYQN